MIILEQVIEVRQATQNIAANTRRKFLDDEIIWLLNKNQERFIQSKIKSKQDGSGGFEFDQLDADAIRPILVSSYPLNYYLTADGYTAELPDDYSYLLSDDSRTFLLCGTTQGTTSRQETNLVIPFPLTTKGSAPYYTSFSLVIGATTVTLADIKAYYGSSFPGFSSKEERFTLIPIVLWYLRNALGITVYWEQYLNKKSPGAMIFPNVNAGSLQIDTGGVVNGTTFSSTFNTYSSTSGVWAANRLTRTNKLSTLLRTAFYKPSNQSPVSSVDGNKLTIYGDASFIVTGVRVDYVRKPRLMSLLLNQDCELPSEFHQAICDLTVEYIKKLTASQDWQLKMQDNMTRSPVV